jgi:hypothetical protein
MKASFFSVVALAMSAFAAPAAEVDNAVRDLNAVENVHVRSNDIDVTKRSISSPEDLISNLESAISSIKTQGGSISMIQSNTNLDEITNNY